jgi:phytoene dehydrogenase-like protein
MVKYPPNDLKCDNPDTPVIRPAPTHRVSFAVGGEDAASLFCQHVAPQLPDGKSWDDHREEVADLMVATIDNYAPGFAASVLGRQILSPSTWSASSACSAAISSMAR